MKKHVLLFILSLLLPVLLFSNEITLNWLEKKPKSLYKDFYIWQYLKQDITPVQALEALGQTRYMGPKIFDEFIKNMMIKTTKSI